MEKYNREDVKNATLKYFKGDTLSTDVWINKYSLKDSEDNIYEMTGWYKRITSNINEIS